MSDQEPRKRIVAICTPAYAGTVMTVYATSLMRTRDALHELGIGSVWLSHANVAAVPRVRNRQVAEALLLGATDVFFIDGDIGWQVGDFMRVLDADPAIVGAVMPTTAEGGGVQYPLQPLDSGRFKVGFNGLAEVKALPTAFMRLRLAGGRENIGDLLKIVDWTQVVGFKEGVPLLFDYTVQQGQRGPTHTGEDFSFCALARRYDYRIWCDPNVVLEHVKLTNLRGSLGDFLIQQNEGQHDAGETTTPNAAV
jgi:hypothetical protein